MKKLLIITAFLPYMAFCHSSPWLWPLKGFAPGSVIITEIMADPSPPVGLPAYEYVELQNPSPLMLSLSGWTFTLNASTVVIPDVTLQPGEYIIICGTTAAANLNGYGQVVGVKSFPSLLDNGAVIVLRDNTGAFIHGVEYTPSWHSNSLKESGGWSLEMIDTSFPFSSEGNWTSSVSKKGGTPCSDNSVSRSNPDMVSPSVANIFPADSVTLVITFSESIANFQAVAAGYDHDGLIFSVIATSDPLLRGFTVTLAAPLERGRAYSYTAPAAVTDFGGNAVTTGLFTFAMTEPVNPGDVMFNEILFDPWPGGHDFIEIVNVSGHSVDASTLLLVSRNPSTATLSAACQISAEHRCIMPGSYYAVTTGRQEVLSQYPGNSEENLHEVPALPSLPDDRSAVLLYTTWLEMVDSMAYDKSMHFSLLAGTEGISLEKSEPGADSGNRQNWHSASSTAGWATPGSVNSVFTDVVPDGSEISLSGRRITPDSDGIDDLLVISFISPSAENVLRVTLFDESGCPVRTLADNLYSGYEASFTWDGTDNNGSLLPTGIYVVFITSFDSEGNKTLWKKAVALLR